MTDCRRCSECPDSDHHWMGIIADVDLDTGDILIHCKHCEATTAGVVCEACEDVVPMATSKLDQEDGVWICSECTASMESEEGA